MANYGAFSSNKIQLGAETTAGTAVAADIVWRGPAVDIEDTRTIVRPEESVGLLVPTSRVYVAQHSAMLSIPETEATFEHFPHILTAAIKTATPSGAGPYVYTYVPGTTSANTIKTYTIETGNVIAGDGNEMEYAFCESFTLSGKAGEAWKYSSNWRGRRKSTATITGGLSLTTLEEMLFAKTSLYIDAVTVGTTLKTGVLMEASITYNSGIQPVFSADGTLYFTTHKFTPPSMEFTLSMELEDGGIVAAERAIFASQAVRFIQLSVAGSGTSAAVMKWAAQYDSVGSYQNSNGNTIVQLSGRAVYDSATPLFCSFAITNSLSALP